MSADGNRKMSATLTQWWSELLRQGHRYAVEGQRGQPRGQVAAPPHLREDLKVGEVSFVVSDVDGGLNERIDEELCAFNADMTGHRDLRLLRVAVRGDGGALLAGLCGSTWGGCGYIDLIWVRADRRHCGLGTRLLEAAEKEIQRRGCDQVALSTYSFQAPAFYIRAGYNECGRRPTFPHGHDQIHFVKRLN